MGFIEVISWIAIAFLASSYWFQIWKIHVHKEVRDLSLIYHILLGSGFGILILTAYEEKSMIFFVKQVATFVPVAIIIGQILKHKGDKWHDEHDGFCLRCHRELEPFWRRCPYCK